MRIAIQSLYAVIAGVAALCFFYLSFVGLGSFENGYTWREMDWNSDGSTTLIEFFEASDVGKRPITVDGKSCNELFGYKDGQPIRVDCP